MAKKHTKNVILALKALDDAQKASKQLTSSVELTEEDLAKREEYRKSFLKYRNIVDSLDDAESEEFELAFRARQEQRRKTITRERRTRRNSDIS